MSRRKGVALRAPRRTWRDVPDDVILAQTAARGRDGKLVYPGHQRAESLHPTVETIWHFICGDHRAEEIIEAWRPLFLIRTEVLDDY